MSELFFWPSVFVICVIALGILICLQVRLPSWKQQVCEVKTGSEPVPAEKQTIKRTLLREDWFEIKRALSEIRINNFMLSGYALLIASVVAGWYWGRLFDVLFPGKNTDFSADLHQIKPLINITMYAVPTTLTFLAVGFLVVGHVMLLIHFSCDTCRYIQRRREGQCKKD